jgi:hypothetical protein
METGGEISREGLYQLHEDLGLMSLVLLSCISNGYVWRWGFGKESFDEW